MRALKSEIDRLEAQIFAWHRVNEASRQLATIPGIAPITASAISAAVPDASMFRSSLSVVANFDEMVDTVTAVTRKGFEYLEHLEEFLDQRRVEFMKVI